MEWEDREDEPIKKKSDGPGNKIKAPVGGGRDWNLFLAQIVRNGRLPENNELNPFAGL